MRPSSRFGRAESGRARWALPSQVTNMQMSIDFARSQMLSIASSRDIGFGVGHGESSCYVALATPRQPPRFLTPAGRAG